jgi:hypothetical protein
MNPTLKYCSDREIFPPKSIHTWFLRLDLPCRIIGSGLVLARKRKDTFGVRTSVPGPVASAFRSTLVLILETPDPCPSAALALTLLPTGQGTAPLSPP